MVDPNFSEAPHLRSSIPPPSENWLRQKSNRVPMNNPTAQVYKNVFFRNKICIPTMLRLRNAVVQKQNKWRKCATSIIVELVLCRQLTAAAGSNVAFPCFLSLFALWSSVTFVLSFFYFSNTWLKPVNLSWHRPLAVSDANSDYINLSNS